MASLKELRRRLEGTVDATPRRHCGDRPAAVLVLILPGPRVLEVVLTRRSTRLARHAGQVSLPGGILESGDAGPVHTALREAEEEIGILRDRVEVLGALPAAHLSSGYCVTPVVAAAEYRPELVPDPDEVAEIFTVPLSVVLDHGTYTLGSRMKEGVTRRFYYFDYQGRHVWGATAAILRSLSDVWHAGGGSAQG